MNAQLPPKFHKEKVPQFFNYCGTPSREVISEGKMKTPHHIAQPKKRLRVKVERTVQAAKHQKGPRKEGNSEFRNYKKIRML